MPKYIKISFVDDYYNLDCILKELKEKVQEGEREELEKKRLEFQSPWINETIKKLIINCFKEIAISSTVPEEKRYAENRRIFFELMKSIDSKQNNSFKQVGEFFDNLKNKIQNGDCIDKYTCFIKWLKRNENIIIEKFTKNSQKEIFVHVDNTTDKFIKELIGLYSKVAFEFPFYAFNFNLSSGEYYFLSLFSELYSMVDKERKDKVWCSKLDEDKVKNLLIMMDEADISLHPRWQKDFIQMITNFIESNFPEINVQIIIATHSPMLLSDFPHTNVLYLTRNEKIPGKREYIAEKNTSKKTFGSNIHKLFLDSFFLEDYGTLGQFAENKINWLAAYLRGDSAEDEYEKHSNDYIEKMIECIGEKVLRNKLEELYTKKFLDNTNNILNDKHDYAVPTTLELLKKQRDEINKLIYELERRND